MRRMLACLKRECHQYKPTTSILSSFHHHLLRPHSPFFRTRYPHSIDNMGDVMVENPATQVLPHRKQISSIPNIDSLEGLGSDSSDEYQTLKKLQRHLE